MSTGVVPTAPPEIDRFFRVLVPIAGAPTLNDVALRAESGRAWGTVAFRVSTALVIAVRPLSAAFSVLMPFAIESRMFDRSDAREARADEVKKLVGLSSAEFTFLPVARRFCVVLNSEAVFWRASRFCRTPADSVILESMTFEPFWSFSVLAVATSITWIGAQKCHGST